MALSAGYACIDVHETLQPELGGVADVQEGERPDRVGGNGGHDELGLGDGSVGTCSDRMAQGDGVADLCPQIVGSLRPARALGAAGVGGSRAGLDRRCPRGAVEIDELDEEIEVVVGSVSAVAGRRSPVSMCPMSGASEMATTTGSRGERS